MLMKGHVASACTVLLLLVLFETVRAAGTPGGSVADLDNVSVRSDRFPSRTITFRNGEYREPALPGAARQLAVKLTDRRAFGVVNGRDAAAAVMATDPGGSGTFYDLALFFKGEGGWVNVDTVVLGDRVKVHSVDMRDSEVVVNMTTHGPGDAQCCPTQEQTQRFAIQADRLVAREAETTSIGKRDIVGPVWRWVRTRYADGTAQHRAAGDAGYTLHLRPDGTVQVRGDCNVSGGSFTVKEANLTITITHSTMAACPDGSLEHVFIRDLGRTGRFHLKNDGLYLELKLDSGMMEFQK
jgi:heat shock protein HslJ